MDKIAQLISNGLTLLGRKIDALTNEIRRTKPPVVNLPPNEMKFSVGDDVGREIGSAIKSSLAKIKIPTPLITLPKQEAPKAPIVNVPAPVVNVEAPIVNVPPANITIEPTPVNFPDQMKVEGMDELIKCMDKEMENGNVFDGVTRKNPLPIMVVDSKGKQISEFGGDMTAPSRVGLKVGTTAVDSENPLPITEGMNIPEYDYISLSYTGDNLTGVVYKTGGSGGTAVATLVLAYSGSTLTSVTKS